MWGGASKVKATYHAWLKLGGYDEGAIAAQLYRVGRVEEYHGSLDVHFERDKLANLVKILTYSTEDQRNDRPNPSKIPFNDNKRNNLASYKSAVLWYHRFREDGDSAGYLSHEISNWFEYASGNRNVLNFPSRSGQAAATDGHVQLNLAFDPLSFRASEGLLRREEIAFGVENLKIGGKPFEIP